MLQGCHTRAPFLLHNANANFLPNTHRHPRVPRLFSSSLSSCRRHSKLPYPWNTSPEADDGVELVHAAPAALIARAARLTHVDPSATRLPWGFAHGPVVPGSVSPAGLGEVCVFITWDQ